MGELLMRYIYGNKDSISRFQKIILLMLLMMYKTYINSLISYIPFIRYLYLQRTFIIPSSKLYINRNSLNDIYSSILDTYLKILDPNDFISNLNSKHSEVICCKEAFNVIPK